MYTLVNICIRIVYEVFLSCKLMYTFVVGINGGW